MKKKKFCGNCLVLILQTAKYLQLQKALWSLECELNQFIMIRNILQGLFSAVLGKYCDQLTLSQSAQTGSKQIIQHLAVKLMQFI